MRIFVNITVLLITIVLMMSCEDIINLEDNIEKELIEKILLPKDSLEFLDLRTLDFGSVKIRSVNNAYVSIYNQSDIDVITIYSITPKDPTGLYQYDFPQGLPFDIQPNEDTEISRKIHVKFIADAFNLGFYYDTLMINNNEDFYLTIKAKVRYY